MLRISLHWQRLPSPPAPPQACSCKAIHGQYCLQVSSAAAPWAPPWLQMEICATLAAGGQSAPPWAAESFYSVPGASPVLFMHWPEWLQKFLSRLSHSALPAAAAQQFYLSKIYSPRCTPTVTHDSALPVSVSYWSWLELAVIWHRGASMFCPFPQTRLCQYNCLHFIEEGLHSVVQMWLNSDSSKIFRFLKRWFLFVLLILLLEILFFNNILSSINIFLRTSMQIC